MARMGSLDAYGAEDLAVHATSIVLPPFPPRPEDNGLRAFLSSVPVRIRFA